MKKTALKSGKLSLQRKTIAALNNEDLQSVNGGIQVTTTATSIQPTTTVQATHQAACITNSAACPGPSHTTLCCPQPTSTVRPSFVC